MKKWAAILGLIVATTVLAGAHCQIPCGIYGDAMRFAMMREHVTTIEKSMQQITTLSENPAKNSNQITRWVINKEKHADALTEIVTSYFLAQRIKASEPEDKYVAELKALHGIIITSMKSKQTTDLKYVAELNKLIDSFEKIYFK